MTVVLFALFISRQFGGAINIMKAINRPSCTVEPGAITSKCDQVAQRNAFVGVFVSSLHSGWSDLISTYTNESGRKPASGRYRSRFRITSSLSSAHGANFEFRVVEGQHPVATARGSAIVTSRRSCSAVTRSCRWCDCGCQAQRKYLMFLPASVWSWQSSR